MIAVQIYWASKLLLKHKVGVLLLREFLDIESVSCTVPELKKRFTIWSYTLFQDLFIMLNSFKRLSRVRKDVNEGLPPLKFFWS
jgi:hypothetical protein